MSKRPTLAPILRANFRPVAAVIASHPDLCLNGWKTPTTTDEYFVESRAALLAPEGQRQIETACAFLELVCTPPRCCLAFVLRLEASSRGVGQGHRPRALCRERGDARRVPCRGTARAALLRQIAE